MVNVETEYSDIKISLTKHEKSLVCIEMGREEYAIMNEEKLDELITHLQHYKKLAFSE